MSKIVFFNAEADDDYPPLPVEIQADAYLEMRHMLAKEDVLVKLSGGNEWTPPLVVSIINFEDDLNLFTTVLRHIARKYPTAFPINASRHILHLPSTYNYVGFYD